jgi:hypothetical protein
VGKEEEGRGRRVDGPHGGGYMSYEEEDTFYMRRRIHVI